MDHQTKDEHHRDIASGGFRAALFGLADGLVTNASLILGFAGASPGHTVVRLAGIGGLVAGAFSMATGEYISVQSQKELFEYEIEVERKALQAAPEEEMKELVAIFEKRGVEPDVAERLAADLMRSPELALRTHAREELGIDPDSLAKPWVAAYSSFLLFSVGALIPLLPWLFTAHGNPLAISLLLTALASAAVGGAVGWFTHRGVVYSALRSLAITTLAAGVTYGVGHYVGS